MIDLALLGDALQLDSGIKKEIEQHGRLVTLKQNEVLIEPHSYIKWIPLVVSGLIRVMRVGESGKELFLYYIEPEQSCAVSLSGSLTGGISHIKALAEDDTSLIAIPASLSLDWFNRNPSWRELVMFTMNRRYDDLLLAIDSVAFSKADERLFVYLKNKSHALGRSVLEITHKEIADDLSTTREMISRLLKNLEDRKFLKLHRNKIELFDLMYQSTHS